MDKFKNHSIIINSIISVLAIIFGIISHATTLIADGLFCFILLGFIFDAKSKFIKYMSVPWILLSAFIGYFSFLNMSQTFPTMLSVPSLLGLPAIAVILILKILLVFMAIDEPKNEENKKKLISIVRMYKLSVFVTISIIVALILSYMTDFYIESAVAFGIAFICIITAITLLKNTKIKFRKKQKKKL